MRQQAGSSHESLLHTGIKPVDTPSLFLLSPLSHFGSNIEGVRWLLMLDSGPKDSHKAVDACRAALECLFATSPLLYLYTKSDSLELFPCQEGLLIGLSGFSHANGGFLDMFLPTCRTTIGLLSGRMCSAKRLYVRSYCFE
jgi:hypothetical protein